jgi:hypothetical protein
MIFDSFMFHSEFDCLDIRLNELWNVVDKFIKVEIDKSYPEWFRNNIKRFK